MTELELRECKSSSNEGRLATGRETASFAGLECVAWRFSETGTVIDLINWSEGCGFQGADDEETHWKAELEQTAPNGLEVAVFWDSDGASACGSCVHDFSIRGERVAVADDDLELVVATRSCTDPICTWSETSKNLDGKEGIVCRYVDWGHVSLQPRDAGKLGFPTRDGECDDSLVATEIRGAARCLKVCTSDDDCESPMRCTSERCQLLDSK